MVIFIYLILFIIVLILLHTQLQIPIISAVVATLVILLPYALYSICFIDLKNENDAWIAAMWLLAIPVMILFIIVYALLKALTSGDGSQCRAI